MSFRDVVSIFYPDSKARLGELVVDAFVHETYTFLSEVSEHPIESGSTIVDHVYNKPFQLCLDGIISNTPMTLVGLTAFDSLTRAVHNESNDFALIAFSKLEKIFEERKAISIATSLKNYDNMVLESLSIERGGGFYSESLHFTFAARQIRFVEQKSIEPPKPRVERAKPKARRGQQEAKAIPQEQTANLKENNSLFYSLGKKLFGGS